MEGQMLSTSFNSLGQLMTLKMLLLEKWMQS